MKMKKLQDYIITTIDNRGKNPKQYYEDEKHPVIDNVLIKNALYPDMKAVARYIDQDTFDNFLRGYVHKNMPLITLVGNGIGNVTLAPSDEVAIVQNTIGFVVNEELDEIFLYYYLKYNQERIRGFNRGSGQPSIKKTDILSMEVDFPDILIQKKIVNALMGIDEKIEINNAINRNLLEQARTLYKSWFIDFEPYGREMPDDWHCGTVDEIIELHDSVRKPLSGNERDKLEKIYPYYGATSIMDYVDDYLFDGIYLLLGEDGSVIDAEGYPILQYVFGKFWANNHAHIITGKNGFSVEELYLLFSLTHIQDIVTGAVQLKISQQNLKKVEAIIPSMSELRKFDEIIQPMFGQIRNLRLENEKLNALRDSLLPKLLSGDLDVSDLDI